MQLEEYARMHELEDEYWWFVARRDLIAGLLTDLNLSKPLRILDIGCGTGAMLDVLAPYGDVVGADYSPEALSYCAQRGASSGQRYKLARADIRRLPFQSGSFDVVTAMDVIEHIDDDGAALREIARVLRPGGALLATVPAYRSLWSEHDVALHHYRRYTAHNFRRVIAQADLGIDKLSYTVSALFPAIWAYRTVNRAIGRLRGQAQISNGGNSIQPGAAGQNESGDAPQADLVSFAQPINRALIGLQKAETALVRRTCLPFGVTVVAVARKPRLPRISD